MSENKGSSRRKFLKISAQAGLALGASSTLPPFIHTASAKNYYNGNNFPKTTFDQTPLAYAYNALEPIIDAQTMEIHYTKHAAAYSKNLKEAAQAENVTADTAVEDILAKISKYTPKMRNNGGGHFNHELFWKSMKSGAEEKPGGKLLTDIESAFGGFAGFKTQFSDAAKNRFGSGWAWLYVDGTKKLKIGSTPNQDNPLMDISEIKGFPLLGLDVWEHAYYLKYQNRRPEYIENWFRAINWDFVQKRYESM
jgi:Fe-Mn family superoxide dismutase